MPLSETNPEASVMTPSKKSIHPIDRQAGALVRHTRMSVGMTQNELACRLGVSFQQIQKYEKGLNRISTSRLVGLALALGVPPASLLPRSATESTPAYDPSEHRAAKIARRIEDKVTLKHWLDLGERLTVIGHEEMAALLDS
ncbi:MAG: helix-turn-helix transcriptional regulator [Planctomycetota bacterium]